MYLEKQYTHMYTEEYKIFKWFIRWCL